MENNASNYKTRTMFTPMVNPSVDGMWQMGIDLGYSGNKIYAQNKVACFPFYGKRVRGEMMMTQSDDTDIWYQDGITKEIWAVGETAINMMTSSETNDNAVSMYSRNRYEDPMFLVMLRVSLGIGLMGNTFGSSLGKELFIRTGLPADYMQDEDVLRDVFCQHHVFALKVGNTSRWETFDIELDEEHVSVISQPKGTLLSTMLEDDGEYASDGAKIQKERTLILDGGFNTIDLIRMANGFLDDQPVTFNDMGMKQVFLETSASIEKQYREHIEVPYMQYILKTGKAVGYDRKTRSSYDIDVSKILSENSKKICLQVIDKLRTMYNELKDVDNLVVTGGTGEAWWDIIKEELSGLHSLNVIPGNKNSSFPFTFSNVRGYYLSQYRQLKKKAKRG